MVKKDKIPPSQGEDEGYHYSSEEFSDCGLGSD